MGTFRQADRGYDSTAGLYFDLQEFQKNMGVEAEKYRVKLDGDFFGFSDLLRRGRIPEASFSLFRRQMEELSLLLPLLFSCGNGHLEFESAKRESVQVQDIADRPNDLFDARSAPLLRPVLGRETHLYQLKFRCRTDTFRRFMNALEESLLPAIPRLVQAETPAPRSGADESGRWIVTEPKFSDFTLLVEWVQLLPLPVAKE
jgi:hypothetical protein